MVYKYSKKSLIAQYLFSVLYCLVLIAFAYYLDPGGSFFKKMVFGIPMFAVFFWCIMSKEKLNQYVELYNNYVHLNSFRFKDVRQKKALSFNIKYEDIFSIEAKTLPLIGVVGIKINARNLPQKLTITASISKHKELFKKICIYAKDYNPKVYIDEKLEKYIGDGGNE